MDDPYTVLGVSKTASQADISKAYRKLAKELHPDLHPGDKLAEEQFKKVSAAHSLLSDKKKRKRFDAGEIDAEGHERPEHTFYRTYADRGDGMKYARAEDFAGFEDLSGIFADLFGAEGRGARREQNISIKGGDAAYTLRASFLDAANGARRRFTLPDGKALDVEIPAGLKDRQTLRLAGQGYTGIGGGKPGDAYIEIVIEAHPFFTRKENNVHMTLPVTVGEAILGGKVDVPTVAGAVSLTIPKGSNTGATLRLKGQGIIDPKSGQKGDQYVHLQVVLPDGADPELEAFVEDWSHKKPYNPRAAMQEVK